MDIADLFYVVPSYWYRYDDEHAAVVYLTKEKPIEIELEAFDTMVNKMLEVGDLVELSRMQVREIFPESPPDTIWGVTTTWLEKHSDLMLQFVEKTNEKS